MDLRTARSLSPQEFHARRAAERHASRETLRELRLCQARDAIQQIAPGFPALRAVHLFGSVLRPGAFSAASDLDVAVDCAELEEETLFARALEREIGLSVDLRPLRGAIADAVREEGEKVYDG